MKKIYLLILVVLFAGHGQAQVASYLFNQSNGTYTALSGGTVLATATDNTSAGSIDTYVSAAIALPFGFNFNGGVQNTVYMSSNGFITFGPTVPSGTTPISSSAGYNGAVSAFAGDLNGVFQIGTPAITSDMQWKVVGSAPDREVVFQWTNFRPSYTISTTNVNVFSFQVRLVETSNEVKVIYAGNTYLVGTTGYSGTRQVGLRGLANTDFNNRLNASTVLFTAATAGTSNSSTQAWNTTTSPPGMPSDGLTYTWSPNLTAVDYCNLQFPATATIAYGASETIYTRGYEPGVTEAAGAGAGINVWIGTNTSNTNPNTWSNWVPATFNTQVGNDDEFQATIGSSLAAGTYYYASRWQLNGGQYRYGGFPNGFWDGTTQVSGVLTVTPAPPPANDDCAGAVMLSPGTTLTCAGERAGTTLSATPSAETAPSCGASGVNDDVWYSFVATSNSHIVTLSVVSGTTDMGMAAYSGSCGSLVALACSDPNVMTLTGLIPTQTYLIRVWTWTSTTTTTATFNICITTPPPPPANDICSGAIVIPSNGPFPYLTGVTSNVSATNTNDPVPSCQASSNKGIWYSFTPNLTGSYVISSCQNDAPLSTITDNVLSVFTSAAGCTGPFTSIACDDDACTTLGAQAIITTNLIAGTQYYILVYGYSTNVGDVQLKITAPAPMTYLSSTTTQSSTSATVAGSVDQQIVRLQVVVEGSLNPLVVSQLDLNTNGSTNAGTDIALAKVYYTGTSTTFSTATQFGTTVVAPNGNYSTTGSQTLTGGANATNNYFWVVYDIACAATATNVVDGEVTGVTVGTLQLPSVTAPTGSRAITASSTTATTNQPSTATVLAGTNNNQVLRVQITSCAGATVTSIDFNTTGSTNPATDISAARVFYTTTTTFATSTQFGADVATPNGAFTVNGSQVLTTGTGYFWLVYDVPLTATGTNVLDASNVSSVLNGSPLVPTTPNPTGTRAIVVPPSNDNAPGAIAITVDAACAGGTYTNVNSSMSATESKIACKGSQTSANQVWFKFVAPASGFVKVSTDIAGGGLTDTRIGLFSATNVNDYSTFVGIACDDDNGATVANSSTLYANNLTVGSTYYVAVDHWNGSGTGTFCLEVKEVTSAMLSAIGSCTAGQDLTSYNVNYTGWLSATDASGNLRALLRNPAGTGTTSYTFNNSMNINTGAVRQSPQTGTFYLDRNYRIANSAATNIEVQFFFLNTELAALTTADGTILPVLAATRQIETVPGCQANFAVANGATTILPQTSNGTFAGISWIQVTTPGFSNFYLHNAIRAVPVTIEYFKGSRQNSGNLLDWKVACYNSPTATMVLERSNDARKFEAINSITETATRCLQPFSFVDASPLAGMNYYRLKTIDADGKESYSTIVAIMNKDKGFAMVSLMPNPVQTTAVLSISSAAKTTMQVVVSDLAGKQLSKQSVTLIAGNNQVPLKLANLASGTYQVTGVSADGTVTTLRFVKE